MLQSIDAGQLRDWMAYDKVLEEERQRDALAAKAEAGVRNHKRGGR